MFISKLRHKDIVSKLEEKFDNEMYLKNRELRKAQKDVEYYRNELKISFSRRNDNEKLINAYKEKIKSLEETLDEERNENKAKLKQVVELQELHAQACEKIQLLTDIKQEQENLIEELHDENEELRNIVEELREVKRSILLDNWIVEEAGRQLLDLAMDVEYYTKAEIARRIFDFGWLTPNDGTDKGIRTIDGGPIREPKK